MYPLSESVITTIRSAARKLTGWRRRDFQAEVTLEYCGGSARKAESLLGWGRASVATGLNEKRTGIRVHDNFSARGAQRCEERHPELSALIIKLADTDSQADPKFQTTFAFTRLTGSAVRTALLCQFEGDPLVPSERTVRRVLDRLGYRMRRVRKTIPQKKCRRPMPFLNI